MLCCGFIETFWPAIVVSIMSSYGRCKVRSATIIGVEAHPVFVEVIVTQGMPGFVIVGMPDAVIQESRERVRAAIRACGFSMPYDKVVVNLAPGYLKKTGSGFDLPIALGLLAATRQISLSHFENALAVGELALDGTIRPVQGLLAFQGCASKEGLDLICGSTSELPGGMSNGSIHIAETLSNFRDGVFSHPPLKQGPEVFQPDYAEVGGHALAKRALAIAAAGSHGVLMVGPPGSGKTMLSSRLPSILPPLDEQQRLESAQILSIAGEDTSAALAGCRPFRSPHHSATQAGLCGGGNPVRPGEVTLAHNGVLFLDELAEFSPHVLQSIRQPVEDGAITITRADGKVRMPARFMLVAATNPCPCGYFGDATHECTCPPARIAKYQSRIGGPLIDRIDLCIDVWPSDFREVVTGDTNLDSSALRSMVERGREFRKQRTKRPVSGKHAVSLLVEECHMNGETESFFEDLASRHSLSGRGIMRTLSVARTIADMDESNSVNVAHISEAMNLRVHAGIGRTA